MPQVYLTVQDGAVLEPYMYGLVRIIQQAVAAELSVPDEGELKWEDIEVAVTRPGQFDAVRDSVSLIVWTNEYPELRKDLVARQTRIENAIAEFVSTLESSGPFPERTVSVWVLLAPGAYGRTKVAERWLSRDDRAS